MTNKRVSVEWDLDPYFKPIKPRMMLCPDREITMEELKKIDSKLADLIEHDTDILISLNHPNELEDINLHCLYSTHYIEIGSQKEESNYKWRIYGTYFM